MTIDKTAIPSNPTAMPLADRELAAYRLRLEGKTNETIAKLLGFSNESGARKAVKRGRRRAIDAIDAREILVDDFHRLSAIIEAQTPFALGTGLVTDDDGQGAYVMPPDVKASAAVERLIVQRREIVALIDAGGVRGDDVEAFKALLADALPSADDVLEHWDPEHEGDDVLWFVPGMPGWRGGAA